VVFVDQVSGQPARRPALEPALSSANRAGDQLVITKLDRLGSSLKHLVDLSRVLQARGVDLVMLDQGIDTSTAGGRTFFQVLGAITTLVVYSWGSWLARRGVPVLDLVFRMITLRLAFFLSPSPRVAADWSGDVCGAAAVATARAAGRRGCRGDVLRETRASAAGTGARQAR